LRLWACGHPLRPDACSRRGQRQISEDAFKQKSSDDAIKTLYGKTAEPSDKVKLDAP